MTQVNLSAGFSKFETIPFNEENFKKEWSHIEIAGVKAILDDLLEENTGKKLDADAYFQLAYTSTSRFTGLNVCDTRIFIDGYNLNTFIIRNNNQLIAHCFDEDENDVFFEIE